MANEELRRRSVQQEQGVATDPAKLMEQILGQVLANDYISKKSNVPDSYFQEQIASNTEMAEPIKNLMEFIEPPGDQLQDNPIQFARDATATKEAQPSKEQGGLDALFQGGGGITSPEAEEAMQGATDDIMKKLEDPDGQIPSSELLSDDIVQKIEKSIESQNKNFLGDNAGSLIALLAGTALQMVGVHNKSLPMAIAGGTLTGLAGSRIGQYGQAKRQERTGLIEEHLMGMRGEQEDKRFAAAEEREDRRYGRAEGREDAERLERLLIQMKTNDVQLTEEVVGQLREKFPEMSEEDFNQGLKTYDLFTVSEKERLETDVLKDKVDSNKRRLSVITNSPTTMLRITSESVKADVDAALKKGDIRGARNALEEPIRVLTEGGTVGGGVGLKGEDYAQAVDSMINIDEDDAGNVTVSSPITMEDYASRSDKSYREYNATTGTEYILNNILPPKRRDPSTYLGNVQFEPDEIKDITLARFASTPPKKEGAFSRVGRHVAKSLAPTADIPEHVMEGSTEPLSSVSAMNNMWANVAANARVVRDVNGARSLGVMLTDEEMQAIPQMVVIANMPFKGDEVTEETVMTFLEEAIKTKALTSKFDERLSKLWNGTLEWRSQ